MISEMDIFKSRVRHTFANQWNGLLGDFWYKYAREEVERLYNERDNMIIEDGGAVRWKSSGNYLPDDCMEKLEYAPYDLSSKISREATRIKREIQDKEFIEEYKKNPPVLTQEDFYEMQAAFGKGVRVTNIITGEVIEI